MKFSSNYTKLYLELPNEEGKCEQSNYKLYEYQCEYDLTTLSNEVMFPWQKNLEVWTFELH